MKKRDDFTVQDLDRLCNNATKLVELLDSHQAMVQLYGKARKARYDQDDFVHFVCVCVLTGPTFDETWRDPHDIPLEDFFPDAFAHAIKTSLEGYLEVQKAINVSWKAIAPCMQTVVEAGYNVVCCRGKRK